MLIPNGPGISVPNKFDILIKIMLGVPNWWPAFLKVPLGTCSRAPHRLSIRSCSLKGIVNTLSSFSAVVLNLPCSQPQFLHGNGEIFKISSVSSGMGPLQSVVTSAHLFGLTWNFDQMTYAHMSWLNGFSKRRWVSISSCIDMKLRSSDRGSYVPMWKRIQGVPWRFDCSDKMVNS